VSGFVAPPTMIAEVPVISSRKTIPTDGAPYGISFDAVALKPVEHVLFRLEVDGLRQFGNAARPVAISHREGSRFIVERFAVPRIDPLWLFLRDLRVAFATDVVDSPDFDGADAAACAAHMEDVTELAGIIHIPNFLMDASALLLNDGEVVDPDDAASVFEELSYNCPIWHLFLHRVSPFALVFSQRPSSVLADNPEPHPQSCLVPPESFSSRGQPFVSEALAINGSNETVQPSKGVDSDVASVEAERDLIHVAAQMLRGYLMPCADDASLEDGPDAFDGVCVDAALAAVFGVNAFTVVDGTMVEPEAVQAVVTLRLIGADQRTGPDMRVDSPVQRPSVRRVDNHCTSLSAALTEAQNSNLADAATARVQLLRLMLVLLQTANETLIHFDDSREAVALSSLPGASLAETPKHEPCRLLRHAYLLRHLHRTDSLPRRHNQVHGVNPLVQRNMAALENRCRANREIQSAAVATVETTLASGDAIPKNAGWAGSPIRPKPRLKIKSCGLGIRDQCEQLERADCRLAHSQIVANSLTGVKYINPQSNGFVIFLPP
jgi:hypothetical protein